MSKLFDTIVIGLGAMGSAAVYQLAKKGNSVLGIDQFTPPHKLGSSHGDTRITRQAIGEGSEYVPLVLRSYDIWREIEKDSDKKLLEITGGLIMTNNEQHTHHGSHFFDQTVACAKKYDIRHTLLSTSDIAKRFPQFKLSGNEKGYFEHNAGYLRPELCIQAQLELAQRYGAEFALNEKVLSFSSRTDRVIVTTTHGTYEAKKAIVSAGSWVASLLGNQLGQKFTVYRQVLYWFDVDGPISQFEAPNFPVWIWEFGNTQEDAIYGFPAIDGQKGGVKLASEQYLATTHPDEVNREVSTEEIRNMYTRYIQPRFNGLIGTCLRASACLYTVTHNYKFVIDTHPNFPNVIIASPCSGHGFKHSAAIGEVLSELIIEGKSSIDISNFAL